MGNAQPSQAQAPPASTTQRQLPSGDDDGLLASRNVDADAAMVSAALDQLKAAAAAGSSSSDDAAASSLSASPVNTSDPHQFVSDLTSFDACGIAKRLSFFPAHTETLVFSALVSKINKREKRQDRVFAITNTAIYNLAPDKYDHCLRRIKLQKIGTIMVNSLHTQVLIRPRNSHDYIFTADRAVCDAFCSLALKAAGNLEGRIAYQYHPDITDLLPHVVTRGSDNGKAWRGGGRPRG